MNLNKITYFLKGEKRWVFLDQLVFSATSFITTILLARQLGIESFGVYSSIVLFLYLILSVSNAFVVAPFQVLISKVKQPGFYKAAVFQMQLLVVLVLCAITAIILFSEIPFLSNYSQYKFSILSLVAGFLLQDFFRRVFLALDKGFEAFVIGLVSGGLQLIILILFSFTRSLVLTEAFFVIAATYIPALIVAIKYYGKIALPFRYLRIYMSKHFSSGKWLLLTSVLQWSASNFLVAASGLFLGVKALGALRLSQTLFGVLNALLQVLDNYALPKAAVQFNKSADDLKAYLKLVFRQSLYFLLPIALLVIIFSKQIFFVAGGSEYVEYAYTLQGMSVLYLVIFLGYPLRIAIRVYMLNRDFFIAYVASFVFSLLTAQYLISQWQLYGVIVALVGNQLLMLAYWQWVLARKQFSLWK
jgi:O-antigen/teichoic acid export membrane protein